MHRWKRKIFFVLWTLFWAGSLVPASLSRAQTLFEMDFRSDKEVLTLGDEITLTIDIRRGKGFRLLPPAERLNFPPFEIKRVEPFGPEEKADYVREGYRVVLTVFELGEFKIPKFAVSFLDDKGRPGQVLTEEVRVQVVSVGRKPHDTNDIRPIKGPYRFHPRMDPLKAAAFALPFFILLLILVYLLRSYLKMRAKEKEEALSPYERAIRSLAGLGEKSLRDHAAVREFFDELSAAIRRYFTDEFQTGSPDHTTREFLQSMSGGRFDEETREGIREILELSDFVKFARYTPPPADITQSLDLARKVIEANRPRVEETEAGSLVNEAVG